MALPLPIGAWRSFWVGSSGPFWYDDGADAGDPDLEYDGAAAPLQSALTTNAQINVGQVPLVDYEVLRLVDVGVIVGNVIGPAASTDNAIARWDGATGLLLDNSTLFLDNSGNLSKITDDLLLDCGANKTLELTQPVYEDLQVSISNIKVPTSNAPASRLYNHGIGGGVTFPVLGFTVGDYIYFDIQTSHSMKLNTILDNHIHYVLPNTTNIGDKFQFQLDVIAAGINTQWALPVGSPFSSEHTIAANDNTYHRLLEIADIPASNDTVSTIYKCKLSRIAATANEYGSEVYMEFTDCHYQKDTMGSRQEGSK